MIKKFSALISIFLLITVAGCTTAREKEPRPIHTYKKELFERNQFAAVLLDVQESGQSLAYKLKKFGGKYDYTINVPTTFFFGAANRKYPENVLLLDSGIYYINHICLLEQGNTIRWLPGPGLKDNMIVYGAFEVKAGEVLALGVLNVYEGKFAHRDDFELAKSQLQQSDKPELLARVTKGKFFTRGSVMLKSENGHLQLIHNDIVENHRKKILGQIIKSIKDDQKSTHK